MIVGIGGQASIGRTMPALSAAVRGAINVFGESKTLIRRSSGEPAVVARLVTLPADGSVASRMMTMALAAAGEALEPWTTALDNLGQPGPPLPVLLAMPSARPGLEVDAIRRLAREILPALSVHPDQSRSGIFPLGHAGGLVALARALQLIQEGAASICLVGGIDTYLDIETIQGIDAYGRLKGESRPNGLIPGEGAGFILVASREYAERKGLIPLAEVVACSAEVEPQPWYSDKPTLGEGLTRALQALFDSEWLRDSRADVTYCDLNGESWRVDEWVYAYLRTGKRHGEPLDLRHPAACWGDVGAASGTLLSGLAAFELARQDSMQTMLVWTASDTGPYRTACVLRSQEGGA